MQKIEGTPPYLLDGKRRNGRAIKVRVRAG